MESDCSMPVDEPLPLLLRVVRELSRARSEQTVREIVRHAARRLLGADGATIVLRDSDCCYYVDEDAIAPLWKGQRFPLSVCISGWAMLNRQSVVIEDIYADDRIPHDAYRPTFVRSLVMVPIRAADPIGAIGVYWARTRRAGEDEVEIIQALADTTSVALENVRLIADLENRVTARTRQLTSLIGVVSHELRNPLAAVHGALTLAGEDPLPESAQREVDIARRNTERVLRIANDLVDLDRSDHDTLRILRAPIRAAEVRCQVTDTMAALAGAAGVNLVTTVEDHDLLVDGDRIVQALINLVSNAIKFSPRHTTVAMDIRRDDQATILSVTDQGRGIPANQLDRIFDRYAQVDADTDHRISHGAGLGLAITRAIVAAHQGTITVDSDVGVGTAFTIRLPTRRPPTADATAEVLAFPRAGRAPTRTRAAS